MKYAIVEGERKEATPKQKGVCPVCENTMFSKCGKYKAWHWAHRRKSGCDPWWENETEWHRNWKNHFPENWQEVVHTDTVSGEKHIADVKTPDGLVLEFQNSNISREEVNSREVFYEQLIWVVNGDRSDTLDKGNFQVSLTTQYEILDLEKAVIGFNWWSNSKFIERWSSSKSIVYFDFGEEFLWKLVSYEKDSKKVVMKQIDKSAFILNLGGSCNELNHITGDSS